jgi:hypothetical protein
MCAPLPDFINCVQPSRTVSKGASAFFPPVAR